MFEQLSIFDFLPPEEDLETLPIEDMIKRVEEATGLNFTRCEAGRYQDYTDYEAKVKNCQFECGYLRWDVDLPEANIKEGARFISVGWMLPKMGQAMGVNSVAEAIEFFKRALARLDEGTRKVRNRNDKRRCY